MNHRQSYFRQISHQTYCKIYSRQSYFRQISRQQVRQCNNPPQSFGGQPCQGEATQTVACKFINCPVGKEHLKLPHFCQYITEKSN
jgi:hypothetical protein